MDRKAFLGLAFGCFTVAGLLACSSDKTGSMGLGSIDGGSGAMPLADAASPGSEAGSLAPGPDAGSDSGIPLRTILDDDFPLPLVAGVAPTPPMAWNSWNAFFCNVTEPDVEGAADLLVSTGMKDAGYQYVNIDDCWQTVDRTDAGVEQPASNFPDGISKVADYVHGKGLKLGIYSDRGTNTCQGRAGSQGYESIDANTYAMWGVDYLKYDNCNTSPPADPYTMEGQYQTMQAALAATGHPFVFSICSWEFDEWDLTTGQLWRTTSDIQPMWSSIMSILEQNKKLAAYAGPNEWNDPDMLEVGNGMTFPQDKSHFTMWAMMAAPLIAGTNLSNMTSGTQNILTNTEVIAIDQDPLGYQGTPVRIDGDLVSTDSEVWAKPMNKAGERAVVLFNAGTSPADITANFTDIGLSSGAATVRDLWAHSDLGSFTDSYTAKQVPVQSVVALTVTGTEPGIPIGTAYLSDLTWTYVANGDGPVEKDESNGANKLRDGKPLSIQGMKYAKGLGTDAPSMVVYRLGKVCTTFTADVGIDDQSNGSGSVVFHVIVDGNEVKTVGPVTAATGPTHVNVDLTGARRLKLLVTNAGDGPGGDFADWAGATIICP
jgi:alpha-galactosidase